MDIFHEIGELTRAAAHVAHESGLTAAVDYHSYNPRGDEPGPQRGSISVRIYSFGDDGKIAGSYCAEISVDAAGNDDTDSELGSRYIDVETCKAQLADLVAHYKRDKLKEAS